MRTRRKGCDWLYLGLALLAMIPGVCLAGQGHSELAVAIGQQKIYEHPNRIARVAVASPDVASITLLSSKAIMINPKTAGVTQISIWETEQQMEPSHIIDLDVNRSSVQEQASLTALQSDALKIKTHGAASILSGAVDSLETHAQALQALGDEADSVVDATQSDFDSHVQIDIKVVEVSRQNVMRFGFFLGKNNNLDNPALAISAPGNLGSVTPRSGGGFDFESNSGFLPVLNAFNLAVGNKSSGLLSTLSILESNGFAYTIAEPSLSTVSGQTANFLAGGEFPVPVRSGANGDGAVTILYKEYGVRLLLTPTVLDKNRIFMKISPEVSELDFTNAVQSGGVAVPGLRVRRTDTSISLGDGESFVISGMVSRNTVNNIDKFPGLGNLPIIGAFFQSKRFDLDDKELLMVVTPRLVRPIARDAKLPDLPGERYRNYTPSFSEFFLSSEAVPKYPAGMSNQ